MPVGLKVHDVERDGVRLDPGAVDHGVADFPLFRRYDNVVFDVNLVDEPRFRVDDDRLLDQLCFQDVRVFARVEELSRCLINGVKVDYDDPCEYTVDVGMDPTAYR